MGVFIDKTGFSVSWKNTYSVETFDHNLTQ